MFGFEFDFRHSGVPMSEDVAWHSTRWESAVPNGQLGTPLGTPLGRALYDETVANGKFCLQMGHGVC